MDNTALVIAEAKVSKFDAVALEAMKALIPVVETLNTEELSKFSGMEIDDCKDNSHVKAYGVAWQAYAYAKAFVEVRQDIIECEVDNAEEALIDEYTTMLDDTSDN